MNTETNTTPAVEPLHIEPSVGWPFPQITTDRASGAQVWREVSEDFYDQMLEALPPLEYSGGAFLVGEPADHTAEGAIHCALVHFGSRYFAREIPARQFSRKVRELLALVAATSTL